MDWGFLVGFVLGSIVLGCYHANFLYKMCTSNSEKYAAVRADMLVMMIEAGELVEIKKGEGDSD